MLLPRTIASGIGAKHTVRGEGLCMQAARSLAC